MNKYVEKIVPFPHDMSMLVFLGAAVAVLLHFGVVASIFHNI